jgi:hypothetical protein
MIIPTWSWRKKGGRDEETQRWLTRSGDGLGDAFSRARTRRNPTTDKKRLYEEAEL